MLVMREYIGYYFLGEMPKKKKYIKKNVALWTFLTQDHMGMEISKRYSYSFDPIWAKLYNK